VEMELVTEMVMMPLLQMATMELMSAIETREVSHKTHLRKHNHNGVTGKSFQISLNKAWHSGSGLVDSGLNLEPEVPGLNPSVQLFCFVFGLPIE